MVLEKWSLVIHEVKNLFLLTHASLAQSHGISLNAFSPYLFPHCVLGSHYSLLFGNHLHSLSWPLVTSVFVAVVSVTVTLALADAVFVVGFFNNLLYNFCNFSRLHNSPHSGGVFSIYYFLSLHYLLLSLFYLWLQLLYLLNEYLIVYRLLDHIVVMVLTLYLFDLSLVLVDHFQQIGFLLVQFIDLSLQYIMDTWIVSLVVKVPHLITHSVDLIFVESLLVPLLSGSLYLLSQSVVFSIHHVYIFLIILLHFLLLPQYPLTLHSITLQVSLSLFIDSTESSLQMSEVLILQVKIFIEDI